MSTNSSIEWTDCTWNPVSGCTRVSAGCDNCYAVPMTNRLEAMGQAKYSGLTVLNPKGDRHFNGQVRCHEDALEIPLRWKKPRRIFVNSMSDLFHKDVPTYFIQKVLFTIQKCPQHVFQVLTKRPDRMAEEMQRWVNGCGHAVMNHLWLGTSAENQEAADKRIPHLLKCPAAVRFLSVEPLLGPVDLTRVGKTTRGDDIDSLRGQVTRYQYKARTADECSIGVNCQAFPPETSRIDWVIVGCESGPNAREMKTEWAESIRDRCKSAGVAFFMKQMKVGGKVTGELADFPPDLRVREFPSPVTAKGAA